MIRRNTLRQGMNMVLEPWSVTRSWSVVHGWDNDVSSAVYRDNPPALISLARCVALGTQCDLVLSVDAFGPLSRQDLVLRPSAGDVKVLKGLERDGCMFGLEISCVL